MQPSSEPLDTRATEPSPAFSNDAQPTEPDRESREAQIRARAYDRYTDSEVRSDDHFNFYERLIPLSVIHERKNTPTAVDQADVEYLLLLTASEGWSTNLYPVTVSDDSIVPPHGPGTRLRSDALPPAFSIVHGHHHVAALNTALLQGHPAPEDIVVQVAVPLKGTSMGDTEIRLLELSMTLSRCGPPSPATPPKTSSPRTRASPQQKTVSKSSSDDLRRLLALQSWLRANSRFASITLDNLRHGEIARATSQAHKEGVMASEQVQETHLKRYVRALLVFKHAPKAFELYKCVAEQTDPTRKNISITTLSSGLLLKAEPAIKVMLVECLYAHIDSLQKRLRSGQDTTLLRNILTIYHDVKGVAAKLGYYGTTFLDASVVRPNGENARADKCTMREALISVASMQSISTELADVNDISARLQEALRAANEEEQTNSLPNVDATVKLPALTAGDASHQRELLKLKRPHQKISGQDEDETSSMSLAPADAEITQAKVNICDESANTPSEESLPQLHLQAQAQAQELGDERTPVKDTDCGQKRLGSPEPLSIIRRKLLRKNGPVQLSELSPRSAREILRDCDRSKKADGQLLSPGQTTKITALPACVAQETFDRFRLSERNIQSLRAELRTYSSERSCPQNGIYKEVHDSAAGSTIRRCLQFAAFWSDHRAAIEEKGYSQIELPAPLLTSATKRFLKQAGLLRRGVDDSKTRDQSRSAVAENSTKRHCAEATEFKASLACASQDLDGETPDVEADQAVIETALAVIADWIGLYNIENGLPSHAIPETGCSLLQLPKGSNARRPRIAFGLRSRNSKNNPWEPPNDPSYMFIVTAESGFPMWVWERSHVILSGPDELLPLIAKYAKPRRVYVKPRSVLLCRGDLLHAFGASSGKDGHHPAKSVAVLSHLVHRSLDRLGKPVLDGWWMRHIPTPGA